MLFDGVSKPFWLPDADEQVALDEMEVRLICPEEQSRWEQDVSDNHFLKVTRSGGDRSAIAEPVFTALRQSARQFPPHR